MRIDSHQHFWQYHPIKDAWITDDMQAIKKDFLPTDFLPLLQAAKMDGCIAVQADQSEAETYFLLSLAQQYPWIKGVVGWVDICADDCAEWLSHFSKYPQLKGIRHIVQAEKPGYMLQPGFLRGISQLQHWGLSYDILIGHQQLSEATAMVSRFPEQAFVLNHIAKPAIQSGSIQQWKNDIEQLALYPHVYCKISGMVTEASWQAWQQADFIPYLDVVIQAFGCSRIMFGSDWPVCLLAAHYQQVQQIVQSYFNQFSADEQALFWGGNATRFYKL
jgi:L-fuconolactonase